MTSVDRPAFIRVYGWRDWFFRVLGWGLSIEPLRGHRPLFSERYGYRKAWHVAGLCVKPLRRRDVVRRAPWERDPKARGCGAYAEVVMPDATLRRISCENWKPGHGRWHTNRQVRWPGRYRWPENIGEASERLLRDAFDGHIDRLMGLGDNR